MESIVWLERSSRTMTLGILARKLFWAMRSGARRQLEFGAADEEGAVAPQVVVEATKEHGRSVADAAPEGPKKPTLGGCHRRTHSAARPVSGRTSPPPGQEPRHPVKILNLALGHCIGPPSSLTIGHVVAALFFVEIPTRKLSVQTEVLYSLGAVFSRVLIAVPGLCALDFLDAAAASIIRTVVEED
jgi:hypothetical protein